MVNFIFDFDSTLIKTETLNEMLNLSLKNNPEKQIELENITKMGMEGTISFKESLERRLKLGKITRDMVNKISSQTKLNITDGMIELLEELKKHKNVNIFIVSGGFIEVIISTAEILEIPKENIFANEFIFNNSEEVIGVKDSLLLQKSGKAKTIQYLKDTNHLLDKTIMIGDGYTDLETYLNNVVDNYIYFSGVIDRESVRNQSPLVASNSADLKNICLKFIF